MLKRSILLISVRAGGIALAFLFNLLVARQLPEADYGLVIYFYAIVVFASLIARNGNHVWIPSGMARMDNQDLRIEGAVRGIAQAVIYASGIAPVAFFYTLAADPVTETASDITLVATAVAISLAIVAHATCETLASVFVGLKMPMIAGVTSFVLPNLLLLSLAFLFPLETFFGYSVLLLLSYSLVAITALAVGFVRTRPKIVHTVSDALSLSPIIEHLPVTSVVLMLFLNANLDIFVLGNIGAPDDLALFGFVFKIAGGIAMLSVAPRMISGPVFAERHYAGDVTGIKQEFRRITALMAFFAVLSAVMIVVLFPYLAGFVGKYQGHGGLIYAVLLGSVVNVMFGPLLLLLNMTDNNHSIWKYGISFLIAKLVLLACVYHYLGLFWYAIAGSAFVISWNLLLFRLTFVRLKTEAGHRHLLLK